MASQVLFRRGSKILRTFNNSLLRLSSSDSPCPPKAPPQTPPCPPPPPCPSTLCPPSFDPNNPCNYCPPPCPDPDYPDLTRLKKLQCKFQEDNDIPVFLKGGKTDVIVYHSVIILICISLAGSVYGSYAAMQK